MLSIDPFSIAYGLAIGGTLTAVACIVAAYIDDCRSKKDE